MGGIKNKLSKLSNKVKNLLTNNKSLPAKLGSSASGTASRRTPASRVFDDRQMTKSSEGLTIPLSDYRLTSPFSQRGAKKTTGKGSPWVRGAVSRRLTEGSLSAELKLTTLTKHIGIACISLAILSTLVLNIVSSYSSSNIESNAEPVGEVSTLANDDSSTCDPTNINAPSCISLSITSSSPSTSTGGDDANLSLQTPREGGIATGRHTVV